MQAREEIRVYVGGPSRELRRVLACVQALEASGLVQVTSRWFDGAEAWSGLDAQLSTQEQRRRARENFSAMRRASLIWMLWPELGVSEGAVGEVGYALAHRWQVGPCSVRVVISGARVCSSIITAEADYRVHDDRRAFQRCVAYAAGRLGKLVRHDLRASTGLLRVRPASAARVTVAVT